jgi:hypothetical protein
MKSITCGQCNGSGTCPTCHGTGQITPEPTFYNAQSFAADKMALSSAIFDLPYEILARRGYTGIGRPIMQFESLNYGTPNAVWTPTIVDSSDYTNNTSINQPQTFGLTKAVGLTQSWTFTKGVSGGGSISVTAPPFGTVTGTSSVTTTETATVTATVTDTVTASTTVTVLAHKTVHIDLLLEEANIQTPFTGTVLIKGIAIRDVFPGMPPISDGFGDVFRRAPHPLVTVIDAVTIRCPYAGDYNGMHGNHVSIVVTEHNLHGEKEIIVKTTVGRLVSSS